MSFFTEAQQAQLISAIQTAEKNTSGEIRLHVEQTCPLPDPMERAKAVFGQLNMHQTAQQNGVLFYLSLDDRKFALLGDRGIDSVVPPDFWNTTRDAMREQLRQGQLVEGLSEGIRRAGEQLKTYFPYRDDDRNELSDEVSFGK
ncbi:MAG: TPM domain-containing protein [Cytophagaceae bacterium]|nr:TPM domain-containing protein [Cytophagaceae bacterium]